jgi:hypothetical protein
MISCFRANINDAVTEEAEDQRCGDLTNNMERTRDKVNTQSPQISGSSTRLSHSSVRTSSEANTTGLGDRSAANDSEAHQENKSNSVLGMKLWARQHEEDIESGNKMEV